MDSNGQRFHMLADAADFAVSGEARHDRDTRRLGLASVRRGRGPQAIDRTQAEALRDAVPGALDTYGTYAYWDASASHVLAAGALEEPDARERARVRRSAPIPFHPLPDAPTDICLGDDGVVAIAHAGVVQLVDTRERFPATPAPLPGVALWRLAAARGAGFAAIDRDGLHVARLTGAPQPTRPPSEPDALCPCEPNPTPPTWTAVPPPTWRPGEAPVALAMAPGGDLVVLAWTSDGDAHLHVHPHGAHDWQHPVRLTAGLAPATPEGDTPDLTQPATWAISLAFLGPGRLVVLVPGLYGAQAPTPRVAEALVFTWPLATVALPDPHVLPLGDFYPLSRPVTPSTRDDGTLTLADAAPLLRGPAGQVAYATPTGPRAVAPLSKRTSPLRGEARARPLDAHASGHAWHRIYAEAILPPGTGIRLLLAATEVPDVPPDTQYFAHDLGDVPSPLPHPPPRATRLRAPSEIPHERGLLGCAADDPHAGLYTVLVQRTHRAVRTLAGRWLHVRVQLFGTGTRSPELAALRIYGPRFSYVDHYLPELYAETLSGPDADAEGDATPADFLGRFLAIAEGELTPLEDRIAGAYLLTDPRKTPDAALPWLASWVGLAFDPTLPSAQRRALLRVTPTLARTHGTLRGLGTCIDALTAGAVAAGRVVIVEDYRLRRVFATILGAHLEDERDPLLPGGLIVSGNSYVGDTLFLGEHHPDLEQLAALYRDISDDPDFFERFAHRVTVLVHDTLTPQLRAYIDHAITLEAPAHVAVRVVQARWPFLVGVASLVGIDSYLAAPPATKTFSLDASHLGGHDSVRRPPSLDPRLEGDLAEETP